MDYCEQQRQATAIRNDMKKVYTIINDAKNRYIKQKLKLKSKKQAADIDLLFADLIEYENKQAITDAYGWDMISDSERERLLMLWDEREHHEKDGKKYVDRVIQMLDKAMSHIGDDYQEFLTDADALALENERNQKGRWPR
jgi:hypothetical protein